MDDELKKKIRKDLERITEEKRAEHERKIRRGAQIHKNLKIRANHRFDYRPFSMISMLKSDLFKLLVFSIITFKFFSYIIDDNKQKQNKDYSKKVDSDYQRYDQYDFREPYDLKRSKKIKEIEKIIENELK